MKVLKKLPRISIIAVICLIIGFYPASSEAQILKRIGKKIEQSVERRVERKIDQGVERGLDKVEGGVDQTAKDAVSTNDKKAKKSKKNSKADSDSPMPSLIPESLNEDIPYSEEDAQLAKSRDGLVLVSADCDDFAWFKKGVLMEYETKGSGAEKEFVTRMKVESLRNEGNKRIATVLASTSVNEDELELDYICAGNQIYFDLTGMLRTQMEKMGAQGADVNFSFEGGLTSFPKNMYPGMQLEDAVFRMVANAGMSDFVVTSYLTDRTVEKRENVTTPAGTFNCIKVVGKRTTRMNILGMDRVAGKPITEELWIAPKVGVVKSVAKNDKGKVETVQELITLKL